MKNRSAFCFFAGFSLILAACFQPVDIGETFVEKGTAHLRVTNESEDKAYVLEGLELRNAGGEIEQFWEGLDLTVKDKPWEVHTETSGSCTLWYRVKDTEISSTAIGVYPAYPPVEIALNRSHEFSFKGEAIEVTHQDTDGDGLPDAWETEHGFDPANPDDGNEVYVSASGRDEPEHGNGTQSYPYKTLAKAVDKAGRGLNDKARTVVVLGTLALANGNGPDNAEHPGRDDSVFYLGKTRNPVTIKGEGPDNNRGTLTAENSGNKRVLYLDSGANVTLQDMTITGGKGIGGGIYASGAELLTLGSGTEIKANNKGNGNVIVIEGGGIYMVQGDIVMEPGSSVSDNEAGYGGGVRLLASTLTMNGGKITKNNSVGGPGGLNADGSTIKMFGTAEISDNTAGANDNVRGRNGAGVILESFSKLTMHEESKITRNKLTNGYGGGLYVTGESTLTMKGGEISYNECTASVDTSGRGGGVMVVYKSSLIMEGGVIKNNKAEKIGGGIYLAATGASFTIKDGTVYGGTGDNKNEATKGDNDDSEKAKHGHAIYDARIETDPIIYDTDVIPTSFPQ
jgi:hypothetical protein